MMKKNLSFTQKKTWLRLIVISLIILVLAAASCDLIFPKSGPNINKLIEAYWGIDVTSSSQIAGMIMGMQAVGNEEAVKGLTAYAHCRSELYQERGDKLFGAGDTEGARAQYVEALNWGTTNTPHRASDKAGVFFSYSNTYLKDASEVSDISKRLPFYRAAGQNTLKAAKIEPDPSIKAYYYRESAYRLAAGGDKKTAKQAYEQAEKLEPNNYALIELGDLLRE
jgi:tetratricopeptide (TPR) repeat protein